MIKSLIVSIGGFAALTSAIPASAALYGVTMNDGSRLTINTDTQTGTWKGAVIDATFTGAGLANFSVASLDPAALVLPEFAADITIASTSTIAGTDGNGNRFFYSPNQNHQKMLKIMPGNLINLWSWWGTPDCPNCNNIGDYAYTAVSVQSRGYSTSGGAAVPEPGMVGLMGLGVLGLAFARRRRNKVSVNMAPALA